MSRIPVTDPRLTAIAVGSLDDDVLAGGGIKPIPVPVPAAGALSVRRDGNKAWFTVGEFRKGDQGKIKEPIEVSVHIENGEIVFFPQRSAAHRQLMAALGIDE